MTIYKLAENITKGVITEWANGKIGKWLYKNGYYIFNEIDIDKNISLLTETDIEHINTHNLLESNNKYDFFNSNLFCMWYIQKGQSYFPKIDYYKQHLEEQMQILISQETTTSNNLPAILIDEHKKQQQTSIKTLIEYIPDDIKENIIIIQNEYVKFIDNILNTYICKNNSNISIPEVLDTEKGRLLLQKAIEFELCDNNYTWKRTKALLSYFADMASEYLSLGAGVYGDKQKVSWQPFEELFQQTNLKTAKNDYQKTGTLPQGHKIVENLFNELNNNS